MALAHPAPRLRSPLSPVTRLKLLYLLVFSSYGATQLYRTLYWRRIGLDNTAIGLLVGLQPLIAIAAGPLWSLLADRLGIRGRLLTIVIALSIVPMVAMAWLNTFGWLIALNILYALFWSPIQPLMDSIALGSLGEDRHRYAVIRGFGSLGYAPAAWLTGLLIQGRDIRWVFAAYAVLMAGAALLSLGMRAGQGALFRGNAAGIVALLKNRSWQRFMAAVFLAMALQEVLNSYTGLYMDTLGATEGMIGFTGALGSGTQTLLMLAALPTLLRRWGSERLLLLSFGTYVLRFALFALFPIAWVASLNSAFLGLSFGAALVATVEFAGRHAPPGMEATAQALANSLIAGLGRATGGMAGGAGYESLGPQSMFALCGGVSLLGAVGFSTALRKPGGTRPVTSRHHPG